jgi:hypothetical protein
MYWLFGVCGPKATRSQEVGAERSRRSRCPSDDAGGVKSVRWWWAQQSAGTQVCSSTNQAVCTLRRLSVKISPKPKANPCSRAARPPCRAKSERGLPKLVAVLSEGTNVRREDFRSALARVAGSASACGLAVVPCQRCHRAALRPSVRRIALFGVRSCAQDRLCQRSFFHYYHPLPSGHHPCLLSRDRDHP